MVLFVFKIVFFFSSNLVLVNITSARQISQSVLAWIQVAGSQLYLMYPKEAETCT